MGHNSERPGNQQNKSEQSRQTDNVREMRMSSNGDPRMENQTATGRGESVTGDRSQSSSRSAGSEQRGLEGGSFTGSASPTSSGSFAQSEGINRGGASRAAATAREMIRAAAGAGPMNRTRANGWKVTACPLGNHRLSAGRARPETAAMRGPGAGLTTRERAKRRESGHLRCYDCD